MYELLQNLAEAVANLPTSDAKKKQLLPQLSEIREYVPDPSEATEILQIVADDAASKTTQNCQELAFDSVYSGVHMPSCNNVPCAFAFVNYPQYQPCWVMVVPVAAQ